MKNYKNIIFIATIISIMLSSCSDFLERSADDLLIPTKVSHYKELLQGDGGFHELNKSSKYFMHMSDDVEYFDISVYNSRYNTRENNDVAYYQNIYLWSQDAESESMLSDNGYYDSYVYFYKLAMIANICFQNIDDAEGTAEEKQIVKGQAAFTRAFAYFYLANLYAQAYNEAQPTDLCVPIKTDPTPTVETLPRNTIKEVWDFMQADIDTALNNLKGKDITSIYEIKYSAVLVLAMRMALYKEDYESVKKYGEELLSINNKLYDIIGKFSHTGNYEESADVINFINKDNPEIVWSFGVNKTATEDTPASAYSYLSECGNVLYHKDYNVASPTYTHNANNLISQYTYNATTQQGDFRLPYWFIEPKSRDSSSPMRVYVYRPIKYDSYDTELRGQSAMRTGEVYISLAEAYARQSSPNVAQSLYYLNALREKRISPYTQLTAADFATNADLVKFVWEERRRELCFEELHRWWDLRREGQPEIKHYWKGGVYYTLKDHDPAYVLNFPQKELNTNPNLEPNTRPNRNAD